jgi:hypothetical protein
MSNYYDREEQETVLVFDPITGKWRVYSTYPPHIKRLAEIADVSIIDEGKGVEGYAAKNQVRFYGMTYNPRNE